MAGATVQTIPKINGFALNPPRLLPLLLQVALVMTILLFFVWSRLEVVHLEYAISSYEAQLRQAQQESRQLLVEAASLRNPLRIEKLAINNLGLRQPTPDQVIMVD